jgi:hypothetical protein
MTRRQSQAQVVARSIFAAVLAWLVPGLGHWYLRCRARAVILFVAVGLTFWGGVALAGVKSTVNLQENRLWFIPQSFAGAHALAGLQWSNSLPDFDGRTAAEDLRLLDKGLIDQAEFDRRRQKAKAILECQSFWPDTDLGQVYTGVAGLLNLLCILDVLARAQRRPGEANPAIERRAKGGPL